MNSTTTISTDSKSWLCRACQQRFPQKSAALCVYCALGEQVRAGPLHTDRRARVLEALERHAARRVGTT